MHNERLHLWQHPHTFGQELRRPGEPRTVIVIGLTGTMMAVEIAAGIAFGSMALLADGLHMGSHAAALAINALAYIHARRHAGDPRYTLGTGKVNALGGFTGSVLLAVFALMMAGESVQRFIEPVSIAIDQAILVAVLGLAVNGASVFILGYAREGGGDHGRHAPDHHHAHPHDHNLRSAYLHVLADALTSLLAIFALTGAKYLHWAWMDPLMGIVGAVLISRWSVGLMRSTTSVLLDKAGPREILDAIREAIERDADNRVADLHVWSIGPQIHAVIVSVVTHDPREPDHYKRLLPPDLGLAHVTVEVHPCAEDARGGAHSRSGP